MLYTAMASHSSANNNNNISENQINYKYGNNNNNNNNNYRHVHAHAPWLPATATWYGSPDGDGSDGNTSVNLIHFKCVGISDLTNNGNDFWHPIYIICTLKKFTHTKGYSQFVM